MNPLLFPPRLILRAFDDLHAIAEAARRLPDIEATLANTEEEVVARVQALDARLAGVVDLAEGIREGLPSIDRVLGRVEGLDARLAEITALVERVEGSLDPLEGLTESIDKLGQTTTTLGETTAALATTVQPLQGAAERLGRFADRLPGGRGRQ